ncbi:ATP-binding protein [Streptomyces anulatus]|uniref:ATP-binding protein n=1 Tax=Streptomyces anulatus TaxID=1892 RepID=UPI0033F29DA3
MENHFNFPKQSSPPLQALKSLPRGVSRLVGREGTVRELLNLLSPSGSDCDERESVGVSVVAGLPGVGKTALAIHAADEARKKGWFPGGTIFMDLHGYDTKAEAGGYERALTPLLRALGVSAHDMPGNTGDRVGLYLTLLAEMADRGKSVLILLDNASSISQVAPLLPGRAEHRVIVTSRNTLAALPARLIDLGILSPENSANLIVRALCDARPDDPRPSTEEASIYELASLCGHLPLALQIVAALLKREPFRPVSDLLHAMGDANRRLKELHYNDGAGFSLEVASAFRLSYAQLDAKRSRLFRSLSLCPGQEVSLEVAAELSGEAAHEVRPVISDLAQAHLVEPASHNRWRMHDLIFLYSRELSQSVDAKPDIDASSERLIEYYMRKVHEVDHGFSFQTEAGSISRREAFAWFDQERANILGLIALISESNPQAAWVLVGHTQSYLQQRHHFDDAVTVTQIGLDAARRERNRLQEAISLESLGTSLSHMSSYSQAVHAYEQAAAIFSEVGEGHRQAHCLSKLGGVLSKIWKHAEAISSIRKSIEVFRGLANKKCEAQTWNDLGRVLITHADSSNAEAIAAHTAALGINRELRDRRGEGICLDYIGDILVAEGRYGEAIEMHQKALEIFRELNRIDDEMVALTFLGDALRSDGRYEESIAVLRKAVATCREVEDRNREASFLYGLAKSLEQAKMLEEAVSVYEEALEACRSNRSLHLEAHILWDLSRAQRRMGLQESAANSARLADELFRETGVNPLGKYSKKRRKQA